MAGGTPTASVAVGPSETVWRLIEYAWYQPDGNGKKVIQEAAFIGQVSLVRASLVTVQIVDVVKNSKFAKYGIARLSVAEIYKLKEEICESMRRRIGRQTRMCSLFDPPEGRCS